MADGLYFFLLFPTFSFFSLNFSLECTPWQYGCRTNGLELHIRTASANTRIRGAAGGRQLAAARPLLVHNRQHALIPSFQSCRPHAVGVRHTHVRSVVEAGSVCRSIPP